MSDNTSKLQRIKETISKFPLDEQLNAREEINQLVADNFEAEQVKTLQEAKRLEGIVLKLNADKK